MPTASVRTGLFPRSADEAEREQPDSPSPDASGAGVADHFVEMLATGADYLLALVKLQGFHLESAAHALLLAVLGTTIALLLGFCGFVFLTAGAALLLGEATGSAGAGWAIVGAVQLATAGGVALWIRRRAGLSRSSS